MTGWRCGADQDEVCWRNSHRRDATGRLSATSYLNRASVHLQSRHSRLKKDFDDGQQLTKLVKAITA